MRVPCRILVLFLAQAVLPVAGAELAETLQGTSPLVLSEGGRKSAASQVERDLRRRQEAANARNRAEWAAIGSRAEWERYRDVRLARLRASLGTWPEPPAKLKTQVTGTVAGDGFVIENVVYESRPGDWVTGNLYRPATLRESDSMPGILIAHAHHWGKDQGELQDMGMTWARAGCQVLVIDQVGYGERRAHGFHGRGDYGKEFRVGRQDYYHRYDSGMQLHLVGESLMGWMVWDLMRGVDLLLARKGIDRRRIIMLGAVAGGGDPCGVAAALDGRIAAAVPFNFGGPQPETRYPLPADAETSFNYLMGSYWESTRGLRRTATDGFFHWVITASLAPRRLVHAHEFSWDGARDPVWKRYQKIYGEFYGVPDRLAVAHGKGLLRGKSPEASHCGQIGRFHRRMIHPVFERWFGIEVAEGDEFSARRRGSELRCLTPEARRDLKPRRLPELVFGVAGERVEAARAQRAGLSPAERRERLRTGWATILGEMEPAVPARLKTSDLQPLGHAANIRRMVLEVEAEVVVPVLVLEPETRKASAPTVIAIAQGGKAGFLKHRAADLAALLQSGAVVCLPDLRGTGETKAGTSRGRSSGDTNRSVNLLLHDQSMVGQRLRDLRSVIATMRELRPGSGIILWGDSFVPLNAPDTDFRVPRGVERPRQPEPLGGLLALLGALFDDEVAGVFVRSGLSSFQSALAGPHIYLPHDIAVPGALTVGDLCDLATALAPRPLYLHSLVDALNRPLSRDAMRAEYRVTVDGYAQAKAEGALVIGGDATVAEWLRGK